MNVKGSTKYPNLKELVRYHPYHIDSFARHANVTTELLQAALTDDEDLEKVELLRICHLVNVPYTVLALDHLIYLDRKNYRHRCMMDGLTKKLYDLWEYQKSGSKAADDYMKGRGRHELVNMQLSFNNEWPPVTYCQYLGIKDTLDQTLLSVQCENERKIPPRGICRAKQEVAS